MSFVMLLVYVGLIALTARGFQLVPGGFIPQQDKGYLIVNAQLPDGASLQRTEEVADRIDRMILETEGVEHTLCLPGYSVFTSTNASNSAGIFVILDPFEERSGNKSLYASKLINTLQQKLAAIQEATIVVVGCGRRSMGLHRPQG
jgi:multidrug efflux pump